MKASLYKIKENSKYTILKELYVLIFLIWSDMFGIT